MKIHLSPTDRSASWLHMKPRSEVADTFTVEGHEGLHTWGHVDQTKLTQDEWVVLFDLSLYGSSMLLAHLRIYPTWVQLFSYARQYDSRVYMPRPAAIASPSSHQLRRAIAACNVGLRDVTALRNACFSLENALLHGEEHERHYVREWLVRMSSRGEE